MTDIIDVTRPIGAAAPVVLDSPHSGTDCPADFGYAVAPEDLRLGEDPKVDALFADAPSQGATLVAARFPRTYIDPNRAAQEIDPDLLDAPWPDDTPISERTRAGAGVIPRYCGPDLIPIYDRKLTVAETRNRLDGYWHPYHRALRAALDDAHGEFGGVWHLNCHSMEAVWGENWPRAGQPVEYDFILGDRDGTTSDPAFTDFLRETLEGLGYRVGVNDGPKGVELVRANGDPADNRHSVQIEINRALYWDEEGYRPNDGWAALRENLSRFVAAICAHATERCR